MPSLRSFLAAARGAAVPLLAAGVAGALAACTMIESVPVPYGIQPHKVDVQQGNVITPAMVMKLQPQMTRAQVRFVLGSPLLVDPFRTDRWDYLYLYEKGGKATDKRLLTVFFENDVLSRIEGAREDLVCADRKLLRGPDSLTLLPPECAQYTAEQAVERQAPKPLPPSTTPPPDEKGFFGRMWEKVF